MKQERVNVKVVPDNRRFKNDERFPLKLRLTYKSIRKYYGTGHDASSEEWEIINSADAKTGLRKIKIAIATIENDAQKCCDTIKPFSFKKFENEFFDQKIKFENLTSAYDFYISQLKNNGQFGTAKSYQDSSNALNRFNPNLKVDDITKEFLEDFEKWMIARNRSISSVGFYLRPLRTIMNLAKENGIIKPEAYPFGKRKYIIPTARNIKKALNIEQIKQVFNYPTVYRSGLDKAKDFWIFSYLCNGINMSDVARLRWNNVNAETIVFEREKTKRTKRDCPVKIVAIRNDRINAIIKKWGRKYSDGSNELLFNIIEEYDDAETARNRIQQFIHVTNDWMKQMGKEPEIRSKTYYLCCTAFFCYNPGEEWCTFSFGKSNPGALKYCNHTKVFCGL